MQYFMKKFMFLALAVVLMFLPNFNVKAAETNTPSKEDFGDPISITTYQDEKLGCMVTESIYFLPDVNARGKSGSGTYRNEKTFEWGSGTKSTYFAQGYFTWGDGNVSVENTIGNITNIPSKCSVSNKNVTSGTGKYGFIFNNYAYVTFSCTVTSVVGINTDLSVTIRVSESGNAI